MAFNEQISDVLRLLVAARKNIRLYPEQHPSVQDYLDKLDEALRNVLSTRSEITVRIVESELFIDDTSLSRETLDFGGLIDEFNARRINTLSIHADLTKKELYHFAKLLDESEEFWAAHIDIIDRELERRGISHVDVTAGAVLGAVDGHDKHSARPSKTSGPEANEHQQAVDTMWQVARDLANRRSFSIDAVRASVSATARMMRKDQHCGYPKEF